MSDFDRRRFIKTLGSLAISVPFLGLQGCVEEQKGKTVLNFWVMGGEGDGVKKILPAFLAQNPTISVKVQAIPWTTAHQKLLTSYVGDTMPDIFQLGNTWVPEFAQLGVLEPLEPWVTQSAQLPMSDYFEGMLNTNRINGQLLGLPWYLDTRLLFYRKDLLNKVGFDAPPTTWAQWGEMMEVVRQQSSNGDFAFYLPLNEPEPLLALGLQQNMPLLKNNDTQGNFNNPQFKQSLNFYKEIFSKGWSSIEGNAQVNNLYAEFAKGRFVFFMSGPWNVGELKKNMPAALQDQWATAPMPGPTGLGASTAGGASLVLNAKGRHKEAAFKLLEYLSAPQTQVEFYKIMGDLPARRSAWAQGKLSEDVPMRAFLTQLDRVKQTPPVLEWENIVKKMQAAAEGVVRNGTDIETALIDLDNKVDDILEKRRWMTAQKIEVKS